jgi:GxxExxY protein
MSETMSALTGTVIGCAMRVHSTLGPGFLESVYQNALVHELRKAGLACETGVAIPVFYDGVVVGTFVADIVVNQSLIIENKAVAALVAAHEVQLVNYLVATRRDIGLLLNFGSPRLEFKKKFRLRQMHANSSC